MKASLIEERVRRILSQLPPEVKLVAVSKFKPVEDIQSAYNAGLRAFGESRVQELLDKIPLLPEDIQWHFIGHLQTNKVRPLIGKVAFIESVDSERLLKVINDESQKNGVTTNVLLQVHVAAEETKFGFGVDELRDFFNENMPEKFPMVRICGLMAMATNTDDDEQVRNDFATAASLFKEIAKSYQNPEFTRLSMGMSGDWPIAVEEGANIVRIGSAIFGDRQYGPTNTEQ